MEPQQGCHRVRRAAAEAAWRWAQANPDAVYRQPADVHTGAYGDAKLDDEFAWAAAELYLLTGEAAYLDAFQRHARDADVPNWSNVGALGWISLNRGSFGVMSIDHS